jgi:hypothetical protein
LVLLHHLHVRDRTIAGIPDTTVVGKAKVRESFQSWCQRAQILNPKTLNETRSARTFLAILDRIVALKSDARFIQKVGAKRVYPGC